MRVLFGALLLAAMAAAGCGHKKAPAPPPGIASPGADPFAQLTPPSSPKLIITPETGLAGKVVTVNPVGRFVVLNFPIGHLPLLDQRLNVYHLGLKVGEIKVTGPQRDDDVVGDIVVGTAQVGDVVRDR